MISRSLAVAAFVLFGLFTTAATAEILDVTCGEKGCLADGWTITNSRHQVLTEVSCIDSTCAEKGWETFNWNGEDATVECRENACFTHGWVEKRPNGNILAQAICGAQENATPSCWQNGWTTYFSRSGELETRCLGGDCFRYGWESFMGGRKTVRVLCKSGGCFDKGWTIYQ